MKARTLAVVTCLLIAGALMWLLLFHEVPAPPYAELSQGGVQDATSLQDELGTTADLTARELGPPGERSEILVPQTFETGDLEVRVLWRDDRSPVANRQVDQERASDDAAFQSALGAAHIPSESIGIFVAMSWNNRWVVRVGDRVIETDCELWVPEDHPVGLVLRSSTSGTFSAIQRRSLKVGPEEPSILWFTATKIGVILPVYFRTSDKVVKGRIHVVERSAFDARFR